VGIAVGVKVGIRVGLGDGRQVGVAVGTYVGESDGEVDGDGVAIINPLTVTATFAFAMVPSPSCPLALYPEQ
jgi:hypothetical protein